MRMHLPARRGRASMRATLARPVLASACCLFFAISGANAHEDHEDGFEQHHAHEHGKITLNLVVDRDTLVVELDAPAANVIGFEHEPRNDTERNSVLSAAAWIRRGDDLFRTPEEAGCRFVRTEFQDPVWERAHSEDAQGDEYHEHHTDYEARFLYRCTDPRRLSWIEPAMLAKLPNVREAQINIVGPGGQRGETVKDLHARIRLR